MRSGINRASPSHLTINIIDDLMSVLSENLDAMRDRLGSEKEAQDLLTDVWKAFGPILFSSSPEIETSYYSFRVQLLADGNITNSTPSITIKTKTGRETEAIVHELLHINLIRLGFPRLCRYSVDDDAYNSAKGILNIADHRLMLPDFIKMGFSEGLFLTPQLEVEPWAGHAHAFAEGPLYNTHEQYYDRVSKYLAMQGLSGGTWGSWQEGKWSEFSPG